MVTLEAEICGGNWVSSIRYQAERKKTPTRTFKHRVLNKCEGGHENDDEERGSSRLIGGQNAGWLMPEDTTGACNQLRNNSSWYSQSSSLESQTTEPVHNLSIQQKHQQLGVAGVVVEKCLSNLIHVPRVLEAVGGFLTSS